MRGEVLTRVEIRVVEDAVLLFLVCQQMQRIDLLVVTVLITGWELDPKDRRRAVFDFQRQKPSEDLDEMERGVAQAVALHDVRVEENR